MRKLMLSGFFLSIFIVGSCQQQTNKPINMNNDKVTKTDAEWKKELSPEQYHVLREKGTEAAYTGEYTDNFKKGKYVCGGCGYELFTSDMKFESHCGWPSFDKETGIGDHVIKKKDVSFGMVRTEIICARCGGHLGHIFDDGPTPTKQRYCVNSLSIKFIPEGK
ncbi:MAG TPA: peptide-methionine (R)-S-oxide reductase MsrB [Bacteroidia bacterium]